MKTLQELRIDPDTRVKHWGSTPPALQIMQTRYDSITKTSNTLTVYLDLGAALALGAYIKRLENLVEQEY